MKKVISLSLIFIFIIAFNGCKNGKDITKIDKNDEEVYLPFQKSKYKTDKKFIREIGQGEDKDESTASSKAEANARAEISKTIRTLVENIIITKNQQGEKDFKEITKLLSKNILDNVNLLESKFTYNDKTKIYKCWVVMELNRDNIIEKFNYGLKNNNVNIDEKKYNSVLNENMDKLKIDNE